MFNRLFVMAGVIFAGLAALPSTDADFVQGGADCTHAGRKDGTCPSIGAGECMKTVKICKSAAAGEDPTSICTNGTGDPAQGCNDKGNCGSAKHATDDTTCDPPAP